jgi:hypothetical protein
MINGLINTDDSYQIDKAREIELLTTYNYLIEKKVILERPVVEKKWMDNIYNRFLLHQMADTQGRFSEPLAIDFETFSFENCNIDVCISSKNLETLFQFVYHPDYDNSGGLKVGFRSEEDKSKFLNNLFDALRIIKEVDIDAFQMIKSTLKCVCPIYLLTPLKRGDVISFTCDYAVGLIMYSSCPAILTAETIIHETRHNVLNSYLKINQYVKDNKVTVKTPLREDLRPLLGLLHQAYVLSGLVKFYKALLSVEQYHDMENVKKRYNVHLSDFMDSIRILEENKFYLTPIGLKLVDKFAKESIFYGQIS